MSSSDRTVRLQECYRSHGKLTDHRRNILVVNHLGPVAEVKSICRQSQYQVDSVRMCLSHYDDVAT